MKSHQNSEDTLTLIRKEDKLMKRKLSRSSDSKKLNILIVQHVSYESSGILLPYLKNRGHRVDHLRLYQNKARFTKDLLKNDFFIFMGGPMSVNHEAAFPHLVDENKFIQDLIGKEKGILGICLGSQLLAKALGARVYKGVKKEIGWYPVDLTKEGLQDRCLSQLMLEPKSKLRTFQWHGETFDLPKKAVRLASSPSYPNQAFRFGKRIYGFQFHLEMNRQLINRWLKHGEREIIEGRFKPEEIISQTGSYLPSLQKNAKCFIDRMIENI